ncbi:trans-sulfuration enzyme family protein [Paenibacillus yanchengensis]|uniref:Trans-sulfuration enzyme family protein n=1 Tax=Paenibacillus yanchengensis TaxID=2035833 RepID=A0ABW4YFU1_9BACL
MKKETTEIMHYGEKPAQYKGAVIPPIFQNTLFTFEDWDAIDRAYDYPEENYIYSRGNNPTATVVEEKLAQLAHGEKAKLFASGMAAISAAMLHFSKANGHIIAIKNSYGPAKNFIEQFLVAKMGMTVTYVSGKDVAEFADALQAETCIIYLESPSSVIFSLQDLAAVATLAKQHHVKTIIDNTWATPIFQKPLTLGIDLEVHSCTKYIGGHSDVVAGVMIGSKVDLDQIFHQEHALLGGKIAPFEAWLLLRSLRTLPLRMNQFQKNGMKVAQYLEAHPKIAKVYYPGLASFEQAELANKQMSGFSSLMSVELQTDSIEQIKRFVNKLEIFQIGVSWGGFESLVYVPAISYMKEMSVEAIADAGISLRNIRIAIGLEDADDLITDLEQALNVVE